MLESFKKFNETQKAKKVMTPEQAQSSKDREALTKEMEKLGLEGAKIDIKKEVWTEAKDSLGSALKGEMFNCGKYDVEIITRKGKEISGKFCLTSKSGAYYADGAKKKKLEIIKNIQEVKVDGKKITGPQAEMFLGKILKMIILADKELGSSEKAKNVTRRMPTLEQKLMKQKSKATEKVRIKEAKKRQKEEKRKRKEGWEVELKNAREKVNKLIDDL